MLVWIVYAVTADRRGPDVERMNRVEDVSDELGRWLLQTGEAREPTDEESAAFQSGADEDSATPAPKATAPKAADTAKTAE
jgi:hypothetical protein